MSFLAAFLSQRDAHEELPMRDSDRFERVQELRVSVGSPGGNLEGGLVGFCVPWGGMHLCRPV